jgi:hypothetical protein
MRERYTCRLRRSSGCWIAQFRGGVIAPRYLRTRFRRF